MIALLLVVVLFWLCWHMAHGANIADGKFWAERRRALVANPFRALTVVFVGCLSVFLYLSVRTAIGPEPTPLLPALAGLFSAVGGAGLWFTLRQR